MGSRTTEKADQVIDALNQAGNSGKKVVLLWGHNHTMSDEKYDQFFLPGDTIEYKSGSTKDISFYYAAAGCMSDKEYGSGSAYVKGKGLVIVIDDQDRLTMAYHDADGNNVTEGGTYTEGDPVDATAISVSPKTLKVQTGETGKLSVSFTPSDTTNKKVNWSSSDTSVATVNGGVVTGVSKGETTITVTYADNPELTDTATVTVTKAPGQGVTPEDGKKYVILAGDGYALTSDGETVGYTNGDSGSEQYNYTGLAGEQFSVGDDVIPDRFLWTFTKTRAGDSYYIQSNDGRYLNATYEKNDSGGYDGTLKLDETSDVWVVSTPASGSSINSNILKSTNASQSDAGDKYLTHGNGSQSDQNLFMVRSEDNATGATFYEYTDEGTYVADPDDPTNPDDPDEPTGDSSVYRLVSSFTDGKDYLIVDRNSAGSAHALKNPGGTSDGATMDSSGVTVKSGDVDGDGTDDTYITSDASDIIWKASANGDGFNIKNGDDFIEGKSGKVKIFSSNQYSDRYWTYTENQLQHVGGQNTYTVYYSGGFTSTYDSSTEKVYIYEKVDGGTVPDEPDEPDEPTSKTKYVLADTIEDGEEYIITNDNTVGSESTRALKNPGGSSDGTKISASNGKTTVEIKEGNYIETSDTDIVWKATTNDEGFYLTNGGDYLEVYQRSLRVFDSAKQPARYWTYSDGALTHIGGGSPYYLTYESGSFSSGTESTGNIYLFKKVNDAPGPHEHTWNDGDVTKEATCEEDGVKTFTCTECGETKTEAIAATGHTEETVEGKAATCTEAGLTDGKKCSVCGKTLEEQEEIPALGHEEEIIPGKAATCAETGLTEGKKCSRCGEILVAQEEIPLADHSWDQGTVTKEATCTEPGLKTSTCTVCGKTDEVEIPATGHNWEFSKFTWTETEDGFTAEAEYVCKNDETHTVTVTPEITKEEVKSTCTEKGNVTYTALISVENAPDGKEREREKEIIIPALGHEEEVLPGREATCTESGLTEGKKCTRCGETLVEQNEIPARGHHEETIHGKLATCTETGLTDGKRCTVCGQTTVEQETIPATGHRWWFVKFSWIKDGDGYLAAAEYVCLNDYAHTVTITPPVLTETVEPTCTDKGSVHYLASISSEEAPDGTAREKEKEIELSCKDHTEETIKGKPATEKETGLTDGVRCSECGKILVEQKVIPKLPPSKITGDITPSNPVQFTAVDKQIVNSKTDSDPKGSAFGLLQAKGAAKSKTSVKVTWKKVTEAKSYVIYANRCGTKYRYKKLKTVKGTSFTQKKLKKGTYYKYLIVAVDDNKALATSKTIHVATKGGKVGNSKSVKTKAKFGRVSLKTGKTFALKATAVAQSKKLKVKKHRNIAFETSNKKIATVSSKGIIKAVKKGTCYVYAYAQNGVFKKIKVTVK